MRRPMVGSEDRERRRTTDFVEVNDAVYKWYCLARQVVLLSQTVSVLLLQEPLQIAKGIDADTKLKHEMAGLIV